MKNYYDGTVILIDGKNRVYMPIKKQYRGYLGERNCPQFPANSFIFQSTSTIVHFHYCLN